ncbi:MAG: endonuclease domain-containing protein [Persicimonas sp.]
MAPDYKELLRRAKHMRKNPTRAEKILWGKLRKRRLLGKKFRRQHILRPYIVDFYCVSEKLAVEIDGGAHFGEEAAKQDEARDSYLLEVHGVEVVRVSAHDVRQHLDDVLNTLEDAVKPRQEYPPSTQT